MTFFEREARKNPFSGFSLFPPKNYNSEKQEGELWPFGKLNLSLTIPNTKEWKTSKNKMSELEVTFLKISFTGKVEKWDAVYFREMWNKKKKKCERFLFKWEEILFRAFRLLMEVRKRNGFENTYIFFLFSLVSIYILYAFTFWKVWKYGNSKCQK